MKKIALVVMFCILAIVATAEEKRYSVAVGDSPTFGPQDAPVTMIEFLDFQ